ncbi:MAG TPA: tRNA lysidine(34) synthetase TilS, partial [candidate division Zixibacteria bacterium]|nr:tRNA lysidine(34) synthetase TilS [candidate division Zixibacteria bacterium]
RSTFARRPVSSEVMLNKVRQAIRDGHLLAPGDAVLVGLSGGPDSVALLHALWALRKELGLALTAVYINHGIRPAAAKREERFCAALCRQLAVELTIVREDIPMLAGRERKGLEETARDYRYRIYERLADERGCRRIALGHQANDQAETVLFRVLRGTGRRGLAGIPRKRGRVIRPLLDVWRDEILGYLKEHRLTFCRDESNRDLRFRRNFLRHKVMPLVRKSFNPKVERALADLADTLAAEEEYLEGVLAGVQKKVLTETPGGKFELDLRRFDGYDKWIRRRLLRYCLSKISSDGTSPDKEVVERLDRAALAGRAMLSLPGGARAERIGAVLVLGRRVGAFRAELTPGVPAKLERPRLNITARIRRGGSSAIRPVRRGRKVYLDWEKVVPPLEVRSIRPGDRFRPLGLGGRKKVGDFLTDRKVPRLRRDEIPVVADRHGIVWLVGWEIAERVKIDSATRKVLTIECSERLPGQAETV